MAVRQNLRDLPRALTPTAILAGLVAVLVAFTGPLVLVIQAADAAKLDHATLSSWILALTVGSGVLTLPLCLWYRQPIVIAWSIAGSALLVTGLQRYSLPEAVGAYLLAGIAAAVLGWSGLFGRLLAIVPTPIVLGMLAGVLLRFGVGLFTALPSRPLLVLAMGAAYFTLRAARFKAPTVGALALGLIVAGITGELRVGDLRLEIATPVWIWPVWSPSVMLGLGVPLFVLAIASQDAPGVAVLRAAGYQPVVNGPVALTGLGSIATAPLGGHGLNLAALMAAIASSPEAHPNRDLRYGAGVASGLWFILFGLFGATAAVLFSAVPRELVAAVAGLAMLPALMSSLTGAVGAEQHREGGVLALLLAAADVTLLGIGAPFWALVLGVAASRLFKPAA